MSQVQSQAAEPASWDVSTGDARVGVVIPVFNRRTILLETLAHVAAQTHAPEKLVVVDDGSTDGTADAAEAWLSSVQPTFEWRVVRSVHARAAASRNVGFDFVRDLPWVAFLDSDDHWPIDFLERAVGSLVGNPQAVVAIADRKFVSVQEASPAIEDMRAMIHDPIPWFFGEGAGVASCTVLRTAAVVRAGGWQPETAPLEDVAFFTAIAGEGLWLHLPGEAVVFHLGNGIARHEDGNLSQRFADRHLRWARAYELIYEKSCERSSTRDRGRLRSLLAYRWCAATKQLAHLGRIDEARTACDRSLFWCSTYLRAWRWRLRLALTRA